MVTKESVYPDVDTMIDQLVGKRRYEFDKELQKYRETLERLSVEKLQRVFDSIIKQK